MARAFVSAGSNIEPERNVREAIRHLASRVRVLAVSTVYLTEPIGTPDQPPYYNCVIEIETHLPPSELKRKVLGSIENGLGRIRTSDKSAPRTIDLDLILYDQLVMAEEELTLPDPDILRRPFLTAALYELDRDLVLPGTTISIAEAAKNVRDDAMKPLAAYTAVVREELRYGLQSRECTKPDP